MRSIGCSDSATEGNLSVLTVALLKIGVFWDIALSLLVSSYRRGDGQKCLDGLGPKIKEPQYFQKVANCLLVDMPNYE
jgi:hypothetical protein